MKTTSLKISDETARNLYKSNPEMRSLLEDSFPAGFFNKSIEERCKDVTLEECYQATGWPVAKCISDIPERLHPLFLRWYDAIVMTDFANEGKKLNFFDKEQAKCYSVYDLSSGSLAFNFSYGFCTHAHAGDAVRLQVVNVERASNLANNTEYKAVMLDIMTL